MRADDHIGDGQAHLSEDELRRIVGAVPGDRGEGDGGTDVALHHIQSCEICRLRGEVVRRGGWANDRREDDVCPDQEAWYAIAGERATSQKSQEWLTHAANCGDCAKKLNEALEVFSAALQPDEEEAIARLATSRPEWPREFARRLALEAQPAAPLRKRSWWDWRLAVAAACLLVLAILGWNLRPNHGAQVGPAGSAANLVSPDNQARQQIEALLSNAYKTDRNSNYRLPKVPHAEARVMLGGSSAKESSQELEDAYSAARRQSAASPQSAVWLDLLGRAQMLRTDPYELDRAFHNLETANQLSPNDPAVMSDLALAYAMRAEREPKTSDGKLGKEAAGDLASGIELAKRVVALDPSNADNLFNLALMEQTLGARKGAVEDWRKFLAIEPDGAWRKEAEENLARAEADLEKSRNAPDTSPQSFLRDHLDGEVYLQAAVRFWLPHVGDAAVRTALGQLADEMVQEHHDGWLRETLDGPYDAVGFRALAAAVQDNAQGDYTDALREADVAIRRFRQEATTPAILWAQFEREYADRRMLHGRQCSPEADELLSGVTKRRFPYLEAQALLESAGCNDFRGDFGDSVNEAERAIRLAEHAGLRFERMRALGMKASLQAAHGNPALAWTLCVQGLQDYWSAWAPAMRGYHFLSEMEFAAEGNEQWGLAIVLQDEALAALQSDEDTDLQAIAHFRRARLAVATGDTAAVDTESDIAAKLFARSRDQDTTRIHDAESRVGLAALQLQHGLLTSAEQNLNFADAELAHDADVSYYLTVQLQATRGDVEKAAGRWSRAEDSYRKGTTNAAVALATLNTTERLYWATVTEHLYRELVSVLIRRGDDVEAFELWQEHCAAGLKTQGLPSSSVSDGRLRLTYLLVDNGIAIWSSTSGGRRFRLQVVDRAGLGRDAQELLELCRRPSTDGRRLQRVSQRLFHVLLAPVSTELQSASVIVVQPDIALPDIPFEVLQDDGGRMLAQEHILMYSPGTAYDHEMTATGMRQQPAYLLVGDAAPSGGVLPGAAREVQAFREVFPTRTEHYSPAVTRQDLLRSLGEASIFQFVGHGTESFTGAGLLVRQGRGGNPGLLLDVGLLNESKLSGMHLAVLSACSTARGQRGLLDPENLVQGFLRAGAVTVVASRWDVDAASTAQIMTAFYRNLTQGDNVPEALARASQTVRDQNLNQPFYWAAFSVYE